MSCWHGAAFIAENHNYVKMYKCVAKRHHRTAWKSLYDNVCFPIPSQTGIDVVMAQTNLPVINGTNVRVLNALPPPCVCTCKNSGKRKECLYEKGLAVERKRSYSCILCTSSAQTADKCSLRQLFSWFWYFIAQVSTCLLLRRNFLPLVESCHQWDSLCLHFSIKVTLYFTSSQKFSLYVLHYFSCLSFTSSPH